MSAQGWVSLLNDQFQTGAGPTLNTATTATISPNEGAAGKDYLVSPYEWRPGKVLKVYASGAVSSGATTSNLTIFLAAGATPTTLSTTPAMALGVGAITNAPWHMWARIRCLAVASTGNTLETEGTIMMGNTAAPAFSTANGVVLDLPLTSAAVDLTVSAAIMLRATLSAAFGAITCQSFLVTSWN
jgi:hypothetical protein